MKAQSRRQFIRSSAKVLCATPLISGNIRPLWAASSESHNMTIDLTPGAIGVKTNRPIELNALAAKHGFTSVAPNISALAEMSDSQRGELVAMMKRQGLRWGSAGCPTSPRAEEAEYREQLKRLPAQAKVLEQVGGTRMNTYIMPSSNSLTYLGHFKLWARRLNEIGKILADHNQRLGLEYIGTHTLLTRAKYPFIHTMAETKDLIAATGRNNIGFVLDSWHWWQAGDSPEDIRTLSDQEIVAVDLNDAPQGIKKTEQIDGQRELPMATGVIDTEGFLTAIRDVGYTGPVRAEPFNAPLRQLDDDAACATTVAALKKAFALLS